MPALGESERRAALQDADEQFWQIQSSLDAAAESGAIDKDVLERFIRTAQEAAARISDNLPSQLAPPEVAEIRGRLIRILAGILNVSEASSLDSADEFLIQMEAVRHVIRDLLDERPPVELRDAGRIVVLLEAWLPGLKVAQLAELLGYSTRQLQRRRTEGGEASYRAQVVVRLVAMLRHGWTDQGVNAWFYRARRDLGGRRPVDLLDDASFEPDLISAARSGRVQGAA